LPLGLSTSKAIWLQRGGKEAMRISSPVKA
jgi:hypothetical protein